MFEFLRACVQARLNIFVSGGTGSGKTTTLNVISAFIPEEERIVTIEDAAELQLRQEHVITLEARPPNLEGLGEITTRDLLRNSLHMRPDRIIVGECRAGEALDMIQAMSVGQEGSLSTGHANSPPDMLRRLETMILMAGYEMPLRTIREQIASAVDLIVHTARLGDGSRKVVNITEIYGIEDDQILTQDIFEFRQTGIDENGKIEGDLHPTGVRPTFMPKFAASGIELPPDEFGIPADDPSKPVQQRTGKGRSIGIDSGACAAADVRPRADRRVRRDGLHLVRGPGRAGDRAARRARPSAARPQQCLENLQARLTEAGSSLDKIAWANWSLQDSADLETFSEEWVRWFPGDGPVGQLDLMPPQHRRAGFRVSLGVIAETDGSVASGPIAAAVIPTAEPASCRCCPRGSRGSDGRASGARPAGRGGRGADAGRGRAAARGATAQGLGSSSRLAARAPSLARSPPRSPSDPTRRIDDTIWSPSGAPVAPAAVSHAMNASPGERFMSSRAPLESPSAGRASRAPQAGPDQVERPEPGTTARRATRPISYAVGPPGGAEARCVSPSPTTRSAPRSRP